MVARTKKAPVKKRATKKVAPKKIEYVIYSGKENEFMSDVSGGKVTFSNASKAVIFPSKKLADAFLNILLTFSGAKNMGLQVLKK